MVLQHQPTTDFIITNTSGKPKKNQQEHLKKTLLHIIFNIIHNIYQDPQRNAFWLVLSNKNLQKAFLWVSWYNMYNTVKSQQHCLLGYLSWWLLLSLLPVLWQDFGRPSFFLWVRLANASLCCSSTFLEGFVILNLLEFVIFRVWFVLFLVCVHFVWFFWLVFSSGFVLFWYVLFI